jgi:hypothetical protein
MGVFYHCPTKSATMLYFLQADRPDEKNLFDTLPTVCATSDGVYGSPPL